MRNQYNAVQQQMSEIIDRRRDITNQQQQWNYNKEVGRSLQQEPFKYQPVQMQNKVQFTGDIRKMIYDEKVYPEDLRLFNSTDWKLAPVTQSTLNPPTNIPSAAYLRSKKLNPQMLDRYYGDIQLQGRLKGKANQISYNTYFFNLRSNALIFYKNDTIQAGQCCLFFININETCYDYKSETGQYMLLKGQVKNIKILKDESSRELIRRLQKKLLLYSFRGAYALRNEVPSSKVQHYIQGQIDTVGPIQFNKQNTVKDITSLKYYRETIGGFFKLLQMNSLKRNNKSGQIYFPRWLKEQFRDMIIMETWLSTNVIPPQHPLMSLKIKVNNNQKQGLFHTLKYIFPYRKQYLNRSLVIYQSELNDQEAFKAMNNLSFPMYMVGFPNNNLSIQALNYTIKKSSDLYLDTIDLSYNQKLTTIAGARVMNLLNNNPSLKKLIIKGCCVSNDDPDVFFQALSATIALKQLVIDYYDFYNDSLVDYLEQFQAVIE